MQLEKVSFKNILRSLFFSKIFTSSHLIRYVSSVLSPIATTALLLMIFLHASGIQYLTT